MLQSEVNANDIDSDAFRCAIADGEFRDPEVRQGYEPGFSVAVVVRSIREARLQGARPSPGNFLKLCVKHRAKFRAWNADMSTLLDLQYEAEDALDKLQTTPRLALGYADNEMDIPF
jgi:hypothetical protein